jgi:hypothetical protein
MLLAGLGDVAIIDGLKSTYQSIERYGVDLWVCLQPFTCADQT